MRIDGGANIKIVISLVLEGEGRAVVSKKYSPVKGVVDQADRFFVHVVAPDL